MRRRDLLLALWLIPGTATVLEAQDVCAPPQEAELLSDYLGRYARCVEALQAEAPEMARSRTEQAMAAKPTAVPAGEGFAARVRDTIEDFLPWLGVAVDSVSTSDDSKSVTVRLNPIRAGELGSIGLTATATQPEPGDTLLSAVAEAERPAVREVAKSSLDDFSDLTFGLKWGYERAWTSETRRMWGRSYENYRPLIEGQLLAAVNPRTATPEGPSESGACDEAAIDALPGDDPDPQDATIRALRGALGPELDRCLEAWRRDEARVVELDRTLDALALVPFLIDNQPQLVLSAALHDRDLLVGRDGWEAKLAYEHGFENFNTLLRRYHARRRGLKDPDVAAMADAFWETARELDEDAVQAENKLTVTLRYAERDPYTVDETFGEGDDAVPVSIDLPESTEWCGKLEWHRNATWHPIDVEGQRSFPRLHLSAEWVDVSDDPQRRDRLVATLTYEVPLSKGSTLPLSLAYANRSEFLGEQGDRLTAHLAFSYKLPFGKNGAGSEQD